MAEETKPLVTTSFGLAEVTRRRLFVVARTQRRSRAEIMRIAIDEYLDRNDVQDPGERAVRGR